MSSVSFSLQCENVFRNTIYSIPHTYFSGAVAFLVNVVAHKVFEVKNKAASAALSLASFAIGMALSLHVFPSSTGLVALTGAQALQWWIGCTFVVPPLLPGVFISYFGPVVHFYIGAFSSAVGTFAGAAVSHLPGPW